MVIKEVFHMVSKRDENSCNFLEGSRFAKWLMSLAHSPPDLSCSKLGGGDWRLIYRHYATLYFVFCVDSNESELGILDLIQVGSAAQLSSHLSLSLSLSVSFSLPRSLSVCLSVCLSVFLSLFAGVCGDPGQMF